MSPERVYQSTWLSDHSNWLIILDNVDSIATVKSLWPPSKHGCILLTTRNPCIISPQLGDHVEQTKAEPLSVTEGAQFIQARLTSVETNLKGLGELSSLLGGLPIGLCHAIDYQNITESTMEELMAQSSMRIISFELPDEHDADSANFNYDLRFTNIFEQSNSCAYNQAIMELKRRSLIEKDSHKGILKIHRLVRWAVFHVLDSTFPKQVHGGSLTVGDDLDWCRRIAPHIQALEADYRQGKQHLDTLTLMGFAALLAQQCCPWYSSICSRVCATWPPVTDDMDELSKAKDTYSEALQIYENINDALEELYAMISSNAGRHLIRLGEYDEAERLLCRALTIQQRQLGNVHYFTTATKVSTALLTCTFCRISSRRHSN
ncbi:hypothetical protein QBC35DRAFT_540068 [Podospora australis]|uniref:DUF7779 domain-containing protein n=1 Tax=Podospora australis TaxID=1536484 RepID=A0AAN6WM65_9PEZI|nr:hypothetical protein QBC35DRAFT_540068 [Podospora australis]